MKLISVNVTYNHTTTTVTPHHTTSHHTTPYHTTPHHPNVCSLPSRRQTLLPLTPSFLLIFSQNFPGANKGGAAGREGAAGSLSSLAPPPSRPTIALCRHSFVSGSSHSPAFVSHSFAFCLSVTRHATLCLPLISPRPPSPSPLPSLPPPPPPAHSSHASAFFPSLLSLCYSHSYSFCVHVLLLKSSNPLV